MNNIVKQRKLFYLYNYMITTQALLLWQQRHQSYHYDNNIWSHSGSV